MSGVVRLHLTVLLLRTDSGLHLLFKTEAIFDDRLSDVGDEAMFNCDAMQAKLCAVLREVLVTPSR